MQFIYTLLLLCPLLGAAFRMAPQSRLSASRLLSAVDDKVEVKAYFDNEGFNRWNKIYSETGEVNKVQLDIRTGHQQTIDKVLNWIGTEDNKKKTVCDAGCGVGSLALPMATKFKKVFASDISTSMTNEASARAKAAKLKNLEFKVTPSPPRGLSFLLNPPSLWCK
jgi:SAM-dependent methyltransferase